MTGEPEDPIESLASLGRDDDDSLQIEIFFAPQNRSGRQAAAIL
jgi:hypothetical protein